MALGLFIQYTIFIQLDYGCCLGNYLKVNIKAFTYGVGFAAIKN
jgi:hypothetical protein